MNSKILRKAGAAATVIASLTVLFPMVAFADNPVPALNSISPMSAVAGSGSITLYVDGSNFASNAVVYFNGVAMTTTFNSSNQVAATIPASSLASPGTYNVNVLNPTPGGGFSNNALFTVVSPGNLVPVITGISPNTAVVGGSSFNLAIYGGNFMNNSIVQVDGSSRSTTVVSTNQLSATIPASDIALVGTHNITVYNPAPGGGVSNAVTLTVHYSGLPVITQISPLGRIAGSSGFALTVFGQNFNPNTVVNFNGLARTTVYTSSGMLTASIMASDIASAGSYAVTVTNPGVGTSNAVTFSATTVPGLPNTGFGPSGSAMDNSLMYVLPALIIACLVLTGLAMRKNRKGHANASN